MKRDGGPDWWLVGIAVFLITFGMLLGAHVLGVLP